MPSRSRVLSKRIVLTTEGGDSAGEVTNPKWKQIESAVRGLADSGGVAVALRRSVGVLQIMHAGGRYDIAFQDSGGQPMRPLPASLADALSIARVFTKHGQLHEGFTWTEPAQA